MAKLLLFFVFVGLGLALTCTATVYTVGDNSGWDVSSDLDSWVQGKRFEVGDVLLFQYSSSQSVSEVTKASFDSCNVTNALLTGRDGNTSIPLTEAGEKYFISGNKLYCFGGMKLHVTVNQAISPAPAQAPEIAAGAPTSLPRPSNKNKDNNNNEPLPTNPSSSHGFSLGGNDPIIVACICVLGTVLSVLII